MFTLLKTIISRTKYYFYNIKKNILLIFLSIFKYKNL